MATLVMERWPTNKRRPRSSAAQDVNMGAQATCVAEKSHSIFRHGVKATAPCQPSSAGVRDLSRASAHAVSSVVRPRSRLSLPNASVGNIGSGAPSSVSLLQRTVQCCIPAQLRRQSIHVRWAQRSKSLRDAQRQTPQQARLASFQGPTALLGKYSHRIAGMDCICAAPVWHHLTV